MPSPTKSKLRPLLVRPDARYRCFSDGLCCSDIHGLGPLTRSELVEIRRISPQGAGYSKEFEDDMLRTKRDGTCFFLRPDLLCSVHAQWGSEAKPEGCRRFPLGLAATPEGGRVTTEHRCPCRTMGERPDISAEEAASSLQDRAGRLQVDRRIGARVRIDGRQRISFSKWKQREEELLGKLRAGAAPWKLLERKPFPRLKGTSWQAVAEEFEDATDETQFGKAIAWFGSLIAAEQNGERSPLPERPWAAAFDRAEKARGVARSETQVFADWLADEIWSLKWAHKGGFGRAQHELGTRLQVARRASRQLRRKGLHPERAAAEAVMLIDLIGASDYWDEVTQSMPQ